MKETDGVKLTPQYQETTRRIDDMLRVKASFDLVKREILIGGKQAAFYFVDGFVKDDIMEKIMEFTMSITPDDMGQIQGADVFAARFVTYVEVDKVEAIEQMMTQVLSGTIALVIDGFAQAIMIDARTYPARGVEEPDDDKVLRGAHDGFVETLVFNTALIRRRIRDPRLTMEILQIGDVSKTDVVMCFMEGKAKPEQLKKVREKLQSVDIHTLTLGQESLMECLIGRQWYNPFPKVRYTERPDCAVANIVEGKILILVDNTPSVMILPTSIFDFIQDTNDYYFPPLVGTYLRTVRSIVFFMTLFLTPIWYLLMQNPDGLPDWLDFVRIAEPNNVPIIMQLLIIEFVIDGLKLASLNTPGVLNNAFGVVGALILGEFAVKARLFVPEVLLYMAFVAVSTFTQPSFELGYAFKMFRILFLILTALFHLWGFIAGVIIMIIALVTTHTITGHGYLFPLIPFNGKALLRLVIRRKIHWDNT